jgi:hypothetical protein
MHAFASLLPEPVNQVAKTALPPRGRWSAGGGFALIRPSGHSARETSSAATIGDRPRAILAPSAEITAVRMTF